MVQMAVGHDDGCDFLWAGTRAKYRLEMGQVQRAGIDDGQIAGSDNIGVGAAVGHR